jgi:hypothetical protein
VKDWTVNISETLDPADEKKELKRTGKDLAVLKQWILNFRKYSNE